MLRASPRRASAQGGEHPTGKGLKMDKKPAAQFAEALTILNSYQRALIARIAEETVENRSDFEACYLGKAEDIVDGSVRP